MDSILLPFEMYLVDLPLNGELVALSTKQAIKSIIYHKNFTPPSILKSKKGTVIRFNWVTLSQ